MRTFTVVSEITLEVSDIDNVSEVLKALDDANTRLKNCVEDTIRRGELWNYEFGIYTKSEAERRVLGGKITIEDRKF